MNYKILPDGKIISAEDVGRIITQRRKSQNLTQADLAGLGNMGIRFLSELENGKGTVQFDKVMQVLDLLGLDVVILKRDR
ncbi:helix-turn-helix domain-containing protein [Methylicorpusculum oleiharenae]|uniref:helix-turn-helix domain-containing protein n=1 Tax=Methylicorpusculum oleiharenae TaxID=1338687 RepID=UPI00135A89A5|nr:helix-turn-helix domain-containing protein [Methylicorpusculum oleiharenae]MCD2448844.1 helix-turn-helix domain-containing protein [Methylicorpusculum oleiharenae]